MRPKDAVRRRVAETADPLVALSRRIHANPELGFEEVQASRWLGERLERAGFAVELGVCDLPTAFVADAGSGPLRLAICAEYDSLPEIGHACGHNLIAAIALGSAVGLRDLVDDLGVTLRIVGTPAEELGNGKALLLERGAFDGFHAAMIVHPAPLDVAEPPLLAFAQFDIEYSSCGSDVVEPPELGIDASAALTIAQVALGLFRAELGPTDRFHGILTHGGELPDRISAHVRASYMARAKSVAGLERLRERMRRCFEAAALATGTHLEIRAVHEPYAEMRHDHAMAMLYRKNAEALGRSFPDLGDLLERGTGSTDMGNVSQLLPAIHPAIGIDSLPAANHQPEFTAHCISAAADRAILDGATALAWTAIDVASDGPLRARLLARQKVQP
jgi:amidohydrolase